MPHTRSAKKQWRKSQSRRLHNRGIKKAISFQTHGKIDAGLAGLTATVPNFFAFNDEDEAAFFRTMAIGESLVTGLTDFDRPTGKLIQMPTPKTA